MFKATQSTGRQKLLAAGAIVVLAILSIQTYELVAGSGAASSIGIHSVNGSTNPAANSTITVSGSGLVNIQPDRAILTIGVTSQDSSAQTAAQQNAAIMSNVITALGAIGINSSSIQTTSYNIYPQTQYSNGPAVITGYQVTNEIQVTIQVPSASLGTLGAKVGQAIDAATAQGANQIYGIQFTASSAAINQATNQALALAVQDAAGRAKVVATALGVTVIGVVSVDASPSYPSPIVYTPNSAASLSTPVVPPQSLQITASVQAIYSIS
ncbi:MAG: SIMPL domain-containing protein [Thaumarchaeota archaeon]|nr:SIMPL domain-containing protein [Nitrososphaerota archaeon]